MIFSDRTDAGERLAAALDVSDATVVVALPRGGVVVGYEVAKALGLSLEVVCPRKIGAPGNPEYAIGAVAESGHARLTVPSVDPEAIAKERAEAKRRLALYRKGRPPRDLKGAVVILVDDGIATGSTLRAAIESLRAEGVRAIHVAVPVGPAEEVAALKKEVDTVTCLQTPSPFYAIGAFYRDFSQTSDDKVIQLLNNS